MFIIDNVTDVSLRDETRVRTASTLTFRQTNVYKNSDDFMVREATGSVTQVLKVPKALSIEKVDYRKVCVLCTCVQPPISKGLGSCVASGLGLKGTNGRDGNPTFTDGTRVMYLTTHSVWSDVTLVTTVLTVPEHTAVPVHTQRLFPVFDSLKKSKVCVCFGERLQQPLNRTTRGATNGKVSRAGKRLLLSPREPTLIEHRLLPNVCSSNQLSTFPPEVGGILEDVTCKEHGEKEKS